MDFVAIGRQAHRDGEPYIAADSITGRAALITLPRGSQAPASREYSEGWRAEQRDADPVEALTEDVQTAERHLAALDREISTTRHARRLAALKRDRVAAERKLSRLVTDLGAAVQEHAATADTVSSASRQYFIEQGRHLTFGEVAEFAQDVTR